ncbi:MAG: Mur ligase family protein, partial [Bacillota bacterium]
PSLALRIAVLAAFLTLACLAGHWIARLVTVKNPKKPFVYTARIKRLYGISMIVLCAFAYLAGTFGNVIVASVWPVLLPVLLAVCGFVAYGPEKAISEVYFQSARRKLLLQQGLIRIGITGSYGKTSVKHILGTILAEKYPVLITPQSFNTPMGVARTIRERLLPSHQVFVAEMGARHVGDIREMCHLVKPTIGILTSVGPQHLETFKSMERVTKTKYELIAALPEDGQSFFVDDHAICRQLYEQTIKPKTLVSLEPGDADVWCENGKVTPDGSSFDLCFQGGERLQCQTLLLGEHNILNILLAAAVAYRLGLTKAQILRGIRRIEPVKSRMELMKNTNSYTIINDGFNSNPVSARAALSILRQFPSRRIIVTPGMVELGADEATYNREFGRAIAQAADIAILIGKKRVQPILDGLREAGFPAESIHQVSSLKESTAILRRLATKDDTVLYENDLPDHYQES